MLKFTVSSVASCIGYVYHGIIPLRSVAVGVDEVGAGDLGGSTAEETADGAAVVDGVLVGDSV